METARYWINKLNLNIHPEGGYFNEVYRPNETLKTPDNRIRNYYTSIYFLLESNQKSKFHQIKSDEIWYFHSGSPLKLYLINIKGNLETVILGKNPEKDENLQYQVPAFSIFGGIVQTQNSYSLVSCMVAPGFDFEDFKLFNSAELLIKYPQHKEIINQLS